MLGILLSAIVLSGVGALAQLGAARLAGLRARLVLGTGPRIGPKDRAPGPIELRPIPVWVSARVIDPGAPLGRTIAALAAGPIAMLLVPFAVLVVAVIARGADDPDPGPPLVVGEVEEGSPAEEAGIAAGDVIVSAEGRDTPTLAALIEVVRDRGGRVTRIAIEREGARREVVVTPITYEGRAIVGVRARPERRAIGLGEALPAATGSLARMWSGITGLGAREAADASAPIGPVAMVREVSRERMDGATRAAVVAMAWAAVAPLWATLMAIGSAIGVARARSTAGARTGE